MLQENKHLIIAANGRFEQAIKSPQVSTIKREMGEVYALAFVTRAVDEICVMTSTVMHMDLKTMIASSILKDYWHLRIEEILNALANGVKQKYGQINFKGVDYQTIMQWMIRYEQDRTDLLENRHLDTKTENTIGDSSRTSKETPVDGIVRGLNAVSMGMREKKAHITSGESYFEPKDDPEN